MYWHIINGYSSVVFFNVAGIVLSKYVNWILNIVAQSRFDQGLHVVMAYDPYSITAREGTLYNRSLNR